MKKLWSLEDIGTMSCQITRGTVRPCKTETEVCADNTTREHILSKKKKRTLAETCSTQTRDSIEESDQKGRRKE